VRRRLCAPRSIERGVMYCPQCGSEFVPGIAECPDCRVDLRCEPPAPRSKPLPPAVEPEIVFSSNRAELIAIAKSILMSSDGDFGVRGEEVQDLFGYGRFPAGCSVALGPIELWVAHEDAADARMMLAGLDAPDIPAAPDDAVAEDGQPATLWWPLARKAAKLVAALMILALALELVFGLVPSGFS